MQVAFVGRAATARRRLCVETDGPAVRPYQLRFHNLVPRFIRRSGFFRKIRGQQFADLLNGFDDSMAKFFVLKMRAHHIDNSLPEFLAAFLVNRFVADHGEFMRAGRDENKHGIALACLVHAEPVKFLLGSSQRIGIQLAALNVNANLAGRF